MEFCSKHKVFRIVVLIFVPAFDWNEAKIASGPAKQARTGWVVIVGVGVFVGEIVAVGTIVVGVGSD